MNAQTLLKITSNISLTRARQLIPGLYMAWQIAEVNTRFRRAMWFAQVCEETGGLSTVVEWATGWEYEGRADLGNAHYGDGPRFKGRGFLQLTGRNNYGYFSQWCWHHRGLLAQYGVTVPNDHYFVDHPNLVATMPWAWLSAAHYWIGDHDHGYGQLNAAADANDIVAATYMVNGAQNGIDTRRWYWARARAVGSEIMTAVPPNDPNWSDVATKQEIQDMIDHSIAGNFFGGRADLTKRRPDIYPDGKHGVNDRIVSHQAEINAIKKKVGL